MALDSFLAGYHGEDSMRAKAERMLNPKFMGVSMHIPESFSAPDRTKVRLYRKGGHVHKLTKEQTDMKLPRRIKHKKLNVQSFEEAEHMHTGGEMMRRGGHAHHVGKERKRAALHKAQEHRLSEARHLIEKEKKLKHGGHAHRKNHYAQGGSNQLAYEEHDVKRGGHIHHKRRHASGGEAKYASGGHAMENMKRGGRSRHYDMGGFLGNVLSKTKTMGSPANPGVGMGLPGIANRIRERIGMGMPQANATFKRGGHAHKHTGRHRHAHGGTVYEHQMVGERPSHQPHHYNYESEMMGERPVREPKRVHASHKGLHDMSHGQYLKKGGRAHKKMAAGGVGKIRHGVASKRGLPLSRKMRGV